MNPLVNVGFKRNLNESCVILLLPSYLSIVHTKGMFRLPQQSVQDNTCIYIYTPVHIYIYIPDAMLLYNIHGMCGVNRHPSHHSLDDKSERRLHPCTNLRVCRRWQTHL